MSSVAQLFDEIAAFRQYKPFNALLVLLQRPHASYVLPPQEWAEKFGRRIRPGQQPIVLLQPGGPVMFLFDVSQTEPTTDAAQLPIHLNNPYRMDDVQDAPVALHWLSQNAKLDGVRVSGASHGLRSAGCISRARGGISQSAVVKRRPEITDDVPVRFEVLLNDAHSPTERLATMAHELGHLFCGHLGAEPQDWWKDRGRLDRETEEYEAESVARIVFRRIDPTTQLPPHLDQFFRPGQELPRTGMPEILTAAGRVVEMCQGPTTRRKPRPR